jgi:hypothetical protein
MRIISIVVATCLALPAFAQTPAPASRMLSSESAEITALSHLDYMVGTWTGSGWMMLGPGRRAEFTQTETITKKLGGSLITIDGDGRDAANPERHIHSAFATIYFVPEANEMHFMAFSGGNKVDVVPTLGDHTLIWGFDAPYGKTRFTLDFSSGQWHEIGELSRDNGQTWTKNFEMTLTRSK